MHITFSSDWLSSYIKATRPILEIFKMAECSPDVLNYRMDLFNARIFTKPLIQYWRQSLLFLLTPSQKWFLANTAKVKI
jgi:hypothetical protein